MSYFKKLYEKFYNSKEKIENIKAFAGFDGFIDSINKVVNTEENNKPHIEQMAQFGNRISECAGKSGAFIMETQQVKIGGNMPIFSQALATVGINVDCLGALGYPQTNELFKATMPNNCNLIGITNPSHSNIIEFQDGKIMFSQLEDSYKINWENITNILGINTTMELINTSQIIAFMNWSETPNINGIWKGILKELKGKEKSDSYLFFDLSDPVTKTKEEIRECLNLINEFSNYFNTILCGNENELNLIYNVLSEEEKTNHKEKIKTIYEKMNIDKLSIHTHNEAILISSNGYFEISNYLVDNPKLLTGAGDNFNAGLSLGIALGFSEIESLILGNIFTSFYVRNGIAPNFNEILKYLIKWEEDLYKNNNKLIIS